ncbi:MAG: tpm [Lacunisphaera sp.]|nr:tpm [Lacunisphaera sp.]MDB6166844.1 tpm [Lacunisphaera sp.]
MDETSPSHPQYWTKRYESGATPWDFGGVPAELAAYLKRHPKGGRVFIPGCGSGYEVKAFADAGYDVTAMDFSPAAVERARKVVGPALARNILLGDFFHYQFTARDFDVIYERTFICSFHPDRRETYRDQVASLLKYRGSLLGFFYYQTPVIADGPPFGFAWGTADELFSRYFLLVKDTPVADSLPIFAGRERWQEWHRTSYAGPGIAG